MNIEDLIDVVKATPISDEDINKLREKLVEEGKTSDKPITSEFLNRSYGI